MERFEHFAFQEVPNEEGQQLDDDTRYMAVLAALIGCQGVEEYRIVLQRALDAGSAAVAVKEMVYQAVDYLGIGRVLPFLNVVNEVFESRNITLPLEGQCTTTLEDRLEKGVQVVLVYKCGQEKLNNLYYQVKEQRRCSAWRKTKNPTPRNSSSRSWICTMPEELRIHNWNVNMA